MDNNNFRHLRLIPTPNNSNGKNYRITKVDPIFNPNEPGACDNCPARHECEINPDNANERLFVKNLLVQQAGRKLMHLESWIQVKKNEIPLSIVASLLPCTERKYEGPTLPIPIKNETPLRNRDDDDPSSVWEWAKYDK